MTEYPDTPADELTPEERLGEERAFAAAKEAVRAHPDDRAAATEHFLGLVREDAGALWALFRPYRHLVTEEDMENAIAEADWQRAMAALRPRH